jgi:hypothetical protein
MLQFMDIMPHISLYDLQIRIVQLMLHYFQIVIVQLMVQFIDIMPHIMLHRATYHVTVFMIGNCTDHIITYGSSLSSFVQLLSHFCPVHTHLLYSKRFMYILY